MTIRDHIHAVMRDELAIEPPAAGTDLIASGLFDSLAVVTLLVVIEQRLDVRISLDELDLERIRTVERLESLIADTRAASAVR
jgi:acyl carrier protein